ncbi:hypothetical protein HanPI659440_Chr17g0678091 [Helianthus annuus]|nr:hypothetical protein HanPI659440_Chr17g0678091 [Helianthus annuus]
MFSRCFRSSSTCNYEFSNHIAARDKRFGYYNVQHCHRLIESETGTSFDS